MVAFIFLVKSFNLDWNSFIFYDTSSVLCLPSTAYFFNTYVKFVTSSKTNYFSRSCYFLLFNLYYNTLILASNAYSSGS